MSSAVPVRCWGATMADPPATSRYLDEEVHRWARVVRRHPHDAGWQRRYRAAVLTRDLARRGVPTRAAGALVRYGYDTPEKVCRLARDPDGLAGVPGMGAGLIQQTRAWAAAQPVPTAPAPRPSAGAGRHPWWLSP